MAINGVKYQSEHFDVRYRDDTFDNGSIVGFFMLRF